MSHLSRALLRVAGLACVALVAACGAQTERVVTGVAITAPAPTDAVVVGRPVVIRGSATGADIARVDVFVNGYRIAAVVAPGGAGVAALPVDGVMWTPDSAGTHVLQLAAFTAADVALGRSEPVVVRAGASVASSPTSAASAPAIASPTPAAAASPEASPTVLPLPTQSVPTPSAEPPGLVITFEFANVRSGPDTQYALIGRLEQGARAEVRGRNQASTWWQIAFAQGANGVGWVFGELVQPNAVARAVAVAAAPPLPTRPPATPAPVAQVAPTPASSCGPGSPFWRGSDKDSNGEYQFCVIEDLRYLEAGGNEMAQGTNKTYIAAWHLDGVDEIHLRITGQPGCGGGATRGGRDVPVTPKGTYQFNANEFDGGYWKVGLFVKNKAITEWLAYGEMYLCIR